MNYEQLIKFSFDRPISNPQWYWGIDDNSDILGDDLAIEFLTRLFSSPTESLTGISDAQVNQGLWYLISSSSSPCIDAIFSEKVPWATRLSCIESIKTLFREFFLVKCAKELSHSDYNGVVSEKSPINSICYMFWDLIPWMNGGPDTKVALAFFDIVEDILSLNNIACQESALHGLGHMHSEHSLIVENIIDRFLAKNTKIRPDLKSYALDARKGEVQ